MKKLVFIPLACFLLFGIISCQTTPSPEKNQDGYTFEVGVPITTDPSELALLVIQKRKPAGIHTIDNVKYFNGWSGSLKGHVYIRPGKRNIKYMFFATAGNTQYTSYQIIETVFLPGKVYAVDVDYNLKTGFYNITCVEQ